MCAGVDVRRLLIKDGREKFAMCKCALQEASPKGLPATCTNKFNEAYERTLMNAPGPAAPDTAEGKNCIFCKNPASFRRGAQKASGSGVGRAVGRWATAGKISFYQIRTFLFSAFSDPAEDFCHGSGRKRVGKTSNSFFLLHSRGSVGALALSVCANAGFCMLNYRTRLHPNDAP